MTTLALRRHPHGDYLSYIHERCRCRPCRNAWNVYSQQLLSRHRSGTVSVPRAEVRRYLTDLTALGVTANAIAEAAGVRPESVRRVLDPTRTRPVPATTAAKLVSVTLDTLPDTALVDAAGVFDLLDRLGGHGMTRHQVATRILGWQSWPGDGVWPRSRVTIGIVRLLEQHLDELDASCEDCGDEAIAGGRWCLRCFKVRARHRRAS